MTNSTSGTIAVIGGTGNLGSALGWRLARAGRRVIIGLCGAVRAPNSAMA